MRKRVAETLVEVHHHLCDAALGRRYPPAVGPETELRAQRRLNAVAVEDFAFDFRGLQCLVADQLDFEDIAVVRADMLERTDKFA